MASAPVGLTFVDPEVVVNQLPLSPGQKVADFGCGSGYFSFEFSKRVGPEGQVYSFDVLPSALEAVESRAKSLGLSNIETKRANLEKENGSGLPSESVDWVILKDILFQNKHRDIILNEATRVLKAGGYVLIMEWNPNESLVGPEKELRISPEAMKTLIQASGLSLEKEINVGGFHYAFLAKE
ncbi:MAG: class I SAM-dependent methyltransferase [Patescibacteria group bacterium]